MQINSIGNTNFGLKISEGMYKLLNEGRQEVAKRNSRSLPYWANDKKAIKDMYDNRFLLDVDYYDNNAKTINLVTSDNAKYPLMTLLEDETLDRPYLINLKNKLEEIKSLFSNN